MTMFESKQYDALPGDEQHIALDQHAHSHRQRSSRWRSWLSMLMGSALLVSVLLNIFAAVKYAQLLPALSQRGPPRVNPAELSWDVPSVHRAGSKFNDPDPEIEKAAWRSDIAKPNQFVVALDDDYAASLGLKHSQRWPWDKNKGVYVMHGGHKLHCLHLLRQAAQDSRDQVEQRWSYPHQMHCIEMLLQDVMCEADDQLMYIGYLNDQVNATTSQGGIGTPRVCRDWNKLRAWANEHSACYNPGYRPHDPNVTEIDRYKFCPNGERPWEDPK